MKYQELQFPKDTLFLVTGRAGFIGSNLCEAILKMGYRVRRLDDLSTGKQSRDFTYIGNVIEKALDKDIEPHFGPDRQGDIKHSNLDINIAPNMTFVI